MDLKNRRAVQEIKRDGPGLRRRARTVMAGRLYCLHVLPRDARLMLFRVLLLLLVAGFAQAQEPQRLTLTTLEWPPYVGQDLPGGGYVQQVVDAALAQVGWQAKVTSYPWARALKLAREGRVDGLFPEYYDPQRRTRFLFSDPIPGGPAGLLRRRGDPYAFAGDPL